MEQSPEQSPRLATRKKATDPVDTYARSVQFLDRKGGDYSMVLIGPNGERMCVAYTSMREVIVPEIQKRYPDTNTISEEEISL